MTFSKVTGFKNFKRSCANYLKSSRHSNDSSTKYVAKRRRIQLELLEDRRMLALLGISPELPIAFANSTGTVTYDESSNLFVAVAVPLVFQETIPPPVFIDDPSVGGTRSFNLQMEINELGEFVGGVAGDDFEVTGAIDIDDDGIVDVDGVLLTGEVLAFGFQDTLGTNTDTYDVRLSVTGGLLSQPGLLSNFGSPIPRAAYYSGRDIGLQIVSEVSSFANDFNVDFGGGNKTTFGPIDILPAALGNYVWEDLNQDGIQDANEPGINGVLATLTGTDVFGNPVSLTQVTANDGTNDGAYLFTNLVPGTYQVTFSNIPAGYLFTIKDANSNSQDALDSDAGLSGATGLYTLGPGEINLTVDAGVFDPNGNSEDPASLGDYVWHDVNANGVQDLNEPGIDGATVKLIDAVSGNVIATTLTGDDPNTAGTQMGYYQFTGLTPGVEYQVMFVVPAGFDSVSPVDQGGNDSTDSDAGIGLLTPIVVLASGEHNPTLDAGFYLADPGIDIEKTTSGPSNSNGTAADYDNEDLADGAGVPVLTPGTAVTWTYQVTNTGNVPYTASQVVVTDDAGTPDLASDDFIPTRDLGSDVGSDGILSPGEVWIYTATGSVESLVGPSGASVTFDFSGNSPLDGTNGNVRSFTAGPVSVKATAFSREKGAAGAWDTAYLGSFGGGLGVTDRSEGDGSSNMHTVDNVGRDNYVLFAFDQPVVVDSAFLGYVVNDSDIQVWIGTISDAFSSLPTLNDSVLSGLGFTEVNQTNLSSARLADINAGNISGNVIVIAADTTDTSPEDRFKVELLTVAPTLPGIYENKGTVTVPGANDSDLSHYKNSTTPPPAPGIIRGTKWLDATGNGFSSDDTPLAGTIIYLDADNDAIRDSDELYVITGADGSYEFTGLAAGNYVVREVVEAGFVQTGPELAGSYSVTIASGSMITGKDFANFEKCDSDGISNVSYTVMQSNGYTYTVNDLRNNTDEGDVVTVHFTVNGNQPQRLSFVSYTAPDRFFNAANAGLQSVYEAQTGIFLPGNHQLSVKIPESYYQIDFVCGEIIDKFGPAGSNIFYTPQGRLISADNDGTSLPDDHDRFRGVTLVVGGGAGNDDIRFSVASDPSKVSIAIGNVGGAIQEVRQISLGAGSGIEITKLAANGFGGNDKITIESSHLLSMPAVLRGGHGSDTLTGGQGNDVLLGESGVDYLAGNAGRDLLIGGTESDVISGNIDDDILIGGTTAYDSYTYSNSNALDSIMREWSSDRANLTFAQRVYNISNGTSGSGSGTDNDNYHSRLNGTVYLKVRGTGQNVFDDNATDYLYGNEHSDWILTNNDQDGGSRNDVYSSGARVTDID